jgi:DNA-binding HxlR family transcriptional regulator
VARTVAVIGDRWTLLLLRDCFVGVRRFEAFQRRLAISRTIIADRLSKLVEEGLLRRVPYQDTPVRYEYRLTAKGLSLYPVIASMAHWGNTHSGMGAQTRLRFRHKLCGSSCKPALVCDVCGEPLDAREVEVSGATFVVPQKSAKPRKRAARRDGA